MNAASKPAPDRTVRISRIWLITKCKVQELDPNAEERGFLTEAKGFRIALDLDAGLVRIHCEDLRQRKGKASTLTVPMTNVAGWVAWEDEAR